MKSRFFAILFILATGFSASAQNFSGGPFDEEIPPGKKIKYESWCEGSRIYEENENGISFVWDCSEISERSRCTEIPRKSGEWTIVRATCE